MGEINGLTLILLWYPSCSSNFPGGWHSSDVYNL